MGGSCGGRSVGVLVFVNIETYLFRNKGPKHFLKPAQYNEALKESRKINKQNIFFKSNIINVYQYIQGLQLSMELLFMTRAPSYLLVHLTYFTYLIFS